MRIAIYSLANGLVIGLAYYSTTRGFHVGAAFALAGIISFTLGVWCGAGALYQHMEREHARRY